MFYCYEYISVIDIYVIIFNIFINFILWVIICIVKLNVVKNNLLYVFYKLLLLINIYVKKLFFYCGGVVILVILGGSIIYVIVFSFWLVVGGVNLKWFFEEI